jgi:hypothetical protein
MDPSLQSTSDRPAATTKEVVSSDESVSFNELVPFDELVPSDEPVGPTIANERLHQSVVLLHDAAQQINKIIRPYSRAFVKHVAAELRKEQSRPKLNLVDLCRTTSVMDAAFKTSLLSGSWGVAKKK